MGTALATNGHSPSPRGRVLSCSSSVHAHSGLAPQFPHLHKEIKAPSSGAAIEATIACVCTRCIDVGGCRNKGNRNGDEPPLFRVEGKPAVPRHVHLRREKSVKSVLLSFFTEGRIKGST